MDISRFIDINIYCNCSHLVTELGIQYGELAEVMWCYGDGDDDDEESLEALEHWIVDPWLGRRLTDHGEMVMNFFELTIWGRTTSGQPIQADGVIKSIYEGTL